MSLVEITTESLLCRLHANDSICLELASSDQNCLLYTISLGGLCVSDVSDDICFYHTYQFQLLV